MKLVVSMLLSLLLLSCATVKVTPSSTQLVSGQSIIDKSFSTSDPTKERVIIIRDSGFLGSGCKFIINIDNKDIVELSQAERHDVFLPLGDHVIEVRNSGRGLCPNESASTMVTVVKGVTRALRIGLPSGNAMDGAYIAIMPIMPPSPE